MMQKLSIEEFAYPAGPTGIGELNTVSSGPDEEGANNNLGGLFWKCLRHGTTAKAVANSLTPRKALEDLEDPWLRFSGGSINIGGHGDEGFLETGAGQSGPFVAGKYVAWWTEDDWGLEIAKLDKPTFVSISIYSCHVGAGTGGAELLYRMAKRCGRMVRAGTGFLYSNKEKMWWQSGSVWQVATPTTKPAPIEAPKKKELELALDKVLLPAGSAELGLDAVTTVVVTAYQVGRGEPFARAQSEGEAARSVAAAFFTSQPMDMADVAVAGFRTAEIAVTFKTGATTLFEVINDGLAIERDTRIGYYLGAKPSHIVAVAGF